MTGAGCRTAHASRVRCSLIQGGDVAAQLQLLGVPLCDVLADLLLQLCSLGLPLGDMSLGLAVMDHNDDVL